MIGYIYKVDTNEIAAMVEGETNAEIEAKAAELNYDQDLHGLTYTRAGLSMPSTGRRARR